MVLCLNYLNVFLDMFGNGYMYNYLDYVPSTGGVTEFWLRPPLLDCVFRSAEYFYYIFIFAIIIYIIIMKFMLRFCLFASSLLLYSDLFSNLIRR